MFACRFMGQSFQPSLGRRVLLGTWEVSDRKSWSSCSSFRVGPSPEFLLDCTPLSGVECDLGRHREPGRWVLPNPAALHGETALGGVLPRQRRRMPSHVSKRQEQETAEMKETNYGIKPVFMCYAEYMPRGGNSTACLPADSCPKGCLSRGRRPGLIRQLEAE